MKKLKVSLIALIKINLLCLTFFVLFPSIRVQAMFSDTVNVNMGIKLELGTVSLAVTDEIIGSVNYSGGEFTSIASGKLINNGSLSTKLAYKVNITKEDGTSLRDEELSGVSVVLNFGTKAKEVSAEATALKTKSFTFVKDANNKDVIINPNEAEGIPVTVNYKSNAPTKAEKLTIEVTFRLIQSNAADANAEMFSDEESLKNTVTLVPKEAEVRSDWPTSKFTPSSDGKYSYNLEKMSMVFSEMYETSNSKTKEIRNLNKAVLYIQFPKSESLTKTITKNGKKEEINTFDIPSISTGNSSLQVDTIEVDKKHNGIKITFKLIDSYAYNSVSPNDSLQYANKDKYSLTLDFNINKYKEDYDFNNYDYYSGFHIYNQFFATRLVLNSDLVVPIDGSYTKYAQSPIKLTEDKVNLSFKRFNTTNPESADPINFKDVQLTKETVFLEVKGGKSGQISSLLNSNNTFSLWLNSNETLDSASLNVKLIGDTGNTLVISRKLQNKINSQPMSMRSRNVPLVEEETEQETDSQISVEEPSSLTDSETPVVSAVETTLEESDEEKSTNETEVIEEPEEGIDPATVESNAVLKEETITKEESVQALPKEPISDEKTNYIGEN